MKRDSRFGCLLVESFHKYVKSDIEIVFGI